MKNKDAQKQEQKHYSKLLTCGCCGILFKTWDGYEDQDQDVGFGICKECQDIAEKREEEMVEDAINEVMPHLKPENQEKIKKMSKEQKRYIVDGLIDKGALKWQVGK